MRQGPNYTGDRDSTFYTGGFPKEYEKPADTPVQGTTVTFINPQVRDYFNTVMDDLET